MTAINELFNTWYHALQTLISDRHGNLQGLLADIDPQNITRLSLSDLLVASVAGLPYLSSPYVKTTDGVSHQTIFTSQIFQQSIQKNVFLRDELFPAHTGDTVILASDFYASFSSRIQLPLNDALQLIMTDISTFVSFAQSGAYTNGTSLSLPLNTIGLDLALNTYIISTALAANGYVAQVQTQGTAPKQAASWVDPSTQMVYTIGSTMTGKKALGPSTFQNTFQGNWTTEAALFAGPFACAKARLFDTGDLVNPDSTGGLDLSCVSRLPECKQVGDASVNISLADCATAWTALS